MRERDSVNRRVVMPALPLLLWSPSLLYRSHYMVAKPSLTSAMSPNSYKVTCGFLTAWRGTWYLVLYASSDTTQMRVRSFFIPRFSVKEEADGHIHISACWMVSPDLEDSENLRCVIHHSSSQKANFPAPYSSL